MLVKMDVVGATGRIKRRTPALGSAAIGVCAGGISRKTVGRGMQCVDDAAIQVIWKESALQNRNTEWEQSTMSANPTMFRKFMRLLRLR